MEKRFSFGYPTTPNGSFMRLVEGRVIIAMYFLFLSACSFPKCFQGGLLRWFCVTKPLKKTKRKKQKSVRYQSVKSGCNHTKHTLQNRYWGCTKVTAVTGCKMEHYLYSGWTWGLFQSPDVNAPSTAGLYLGCRAGSCWLCGWGCWRAGGSRGNCPETLGCDLPDISPHCLSHSPSLWTVSPWGRDRKSVV